MRKVSTLLISALLLLAGTITGKAQQYYEAQNWPGEGISEVQVGENVVLQAANFQENRFYNGKDFSQKANEQCIFTFEQAESDIDGKPTYYLKQVSTGFYLQGKDWADGVVKFAASKFKAQPLFVQKAQHFYLKSEWPKEGVEDWTTAAIYDSAHYHKVAPEGAFILALADQPKYFFNNFWGNSVAMWEYTDTNTWFLCAVNKLIGAARLETMTSDLFPNSAVDQYKAGSEAGEVPADVVEAMETELHKCLDLLDNGGSEEQCDQAADALYAQYQKYMKSVIGVNSGYYLIHDYRSNTDKPEWNYVFYDNYNGQAFLSLKQFASEAQTPNVENLTADDAMYVWHFDKLEDGKYKVRSFSSDMYVEAKMKKLHTANLERYFLLTDKADEAGEFTIEASPKFKGGFNIYVGKEFSDRWGMWNTARNGKFWGICEWKDYNDTGSTWKFTPVKESSLTPLKAAVAEKLAKLQQKTRNEKMGNLLNEAKNAYTSNDAYKAVDAQNVTPEGYYTFSEMGLCPDAAMITSNASDAGEGTDMGALVDNNKRTYWHSNWHNDRTDITEAHYLQFELAEPVQTAEFQILKRFNQGGELRTIKVMASNDPAAPTADWTTIGTYGVQFNKNAIMPTDDPEHPDTLNNYAAVVGFQMPEAFHYLRLVAVANANNGLANKFAWMHMAEVRVYQAAYDADASINTAVNKEVINALKAAIEKGEAELSDSLTTQEALTQLSTAYEAYLKATPKPAEVKNLLNTYKQFCDNAQEGAELGFFEEGAKAAFNAVLDEVKAGYKEAMTIDEVKAAVEKLNQAFDEFNKKLHKPEAGKFYRIVSAADGKTAEGQPVFHYGKYIYAQNSGATPLKWGGRTDEGANIEGLENSLEYYWKVIDNGDGTYKLMNAAYGTYMSNAEKGNSAAVRMRLKDDSISVKFTSFKPGTFDIILRDGLYVNVSPGKDARNVVTWNNPSANSLLTFEEAGDQWDASDAISRVYAGATRVKTLPYAVNPEGTIGAKLYAVLGVKKPAETSSRIYLQLKRYEDIIPGGTPFVMVPDSVEKDGKKEPEEWVNLQVANVEDGLGDIQYTQEATTQENGGTVLVGTLLNVKAPENTYYINGRGNAILVREKEGDSGFNTGWFSKLTATTETGDYQIQVDPDQWENIQTGIQAVDAAVVTGKIFDLQGRQVKKAEKGIYIINGKKVLK